MNGRPETIEQAIRNYEGLIFSTAIIIAEKGVEIDVDDIRSMLRVKVWRTLLKFDASHESGLARDNFVFGCLCNYKKDLLKRPRRFESSVEAMRAKYHGAFGSRGEAVERDGSNSFDLRYLSVDEDQVYAGVGDDMPLPSTLTDLERHVVLMMYGDFTMREIDLATGFSRGKREQVVRSIRTKYLDWRPNRVHVPTPPLSRDAVRDAHAHAAPVS
jgi:hypothetical protein